MYKVTFKSQVFILDELWKRGVVLILGYYLINYLYHGDNIFLAEILLAIYIFIEFLPAAFVHYKYLKYNRWTELSINTMNRTMTIKDKNVVHSFHFDQIINLRLALTADMYHGGKRGVIAFSIYHYAFLETNNGDRFIITCLLVNDLRILFKEIGLKAEKDFALFPTQGMWRVQVQD